MVIDSSHLSFFHIFFEILTYLKNIENCKSCEKVAKML